MSQLASIKELERGFCNKSEECEHFRTVNPDGLIELLLQIESYLCATCEEQAFAICAHEECAGLKNRATCQDANHIFPHLMSENHSVIFLFDKRMLLCTKCIVLITLRRFCEVRCGDGLRKSEYQLIRFQYSVGLSGFLNLGNTCYINASLQIFAHCPPFARFFQNYKPLEYLVNIEPSKRSISEQLAMDIQLLWSHHLFPIINPWRFILAFRKKSEFDAHQQQDAQEFIRTFLDILHRELLKPLDDEGNFAPQTEDILEVDVYNDSKYSSIVSDMFQGEMESQVCCSICQNVSSTKELFLDLSLPIPLEHFVRNRDRVDFVNGISLQLCLDNFFSDTFLADENKYACEKCKKHVNAKKSLKISKLPGILCIHLKRFRHERTKNMKIDTSVNFPLTDLNLENHVLIDSKASAKYDLCGFIQHEGRSPDCGHYKSYCLNEVDSLWYEFDDLRTKKITIEEVQKKQAYVLFYINKEIKESFSLSRLEIESKISNDSIVKRYDCDHSGNKVDGKGRNYRISENTNNTNNRDMTRKLTQQITILTANPQCPEESKMSLQIYFEMFRELEFLYIQSFEVNDAIKKKLDTKKMVKRRMDILSSIDVALENLENIIEEQYKESENPLSVGSSTS